MGLFIDQCLSGSTPQFDAVPVQFDMDKRRGSGLSDATRSGADDRENEAAAAGGKSISPGRLSHIPVLAPQGHFLARLRRTHGTALVHPARRAPF